MPRPRRLAPRLLIVALIFAVVPLLPNGPAATSPAPLPGGVLGTYVRGPERMVAGTPAALRIATHWATSEQASGPYPGVDVEVTLRGKDRFARLYRGRTDGAGLADARFVAPSWPDDKYLLEVDARIGGKHDHHQHEVEVGPGGKLLLESDKPLYQPGQVVHLRAVGVRPQDGQPLAGKQVTFSVSDPRGNQVFRVERALSAFGVASADFQLADEILLGHYQASADAGDASTPGTLDLAVEKYLLPKFKLTLDTDRPYYAPGQRAQITVDAHYFFGKPVTGGQVTLDASVVAGGAWVKLGTLHGKIDAQGKTRLELELPAAIAADEASLRLHAQIVDTAEHREEAARSLTVARDPVRLELTTEGAQLVPGVDNRVWVVAAHPDGSPIAGAEIALAIDRSQGQRAHTDGVGVAELRIRPSVVNQRAGECARGESRLEATLSSLGATHVVHRCVAVAKAGALLLRTDKAIYPFGAPVNLELSGLGADGIAYVDLIKDGQTVDTTQVRMRAGHGAVSLPPDERRFGTLALQAYRIAPDGTQSRDAHIIYVERPSALTVELHPEGAQAGTFRPGETGRIRVRVLDAKSGAPAQAEVGVVMVDQSLLALRSMKPGAARLYFTLADEATHPSRAMKATPGGYTVERLVDAGALDELKQEAARILLAGAAPPWSVGWEDDPWQARLAAKDAQVARLGETFTKYAPRHLVGEHVRGAHWRWRRDLVARMVADGALPAKDAHDPWGRAIAVDDVLATASLGEFDAWAREQLDERMSAIYRTLARQGLDEKLPIDPILGATLGKKHAHILALADLEQLAQAGKLDRYLLVDPWGQPWRIEERKYAYTIARLRSRFLLASAGPDALVGTKDDLYPIDSSWGTRITELSVTGGIAREAFAGGALQIRTLRGYGMGGGGSGFGGGVGLGSIGTIGHGAGVGEARVRQNFPETMLWRPEVVTDAHGEASIDVTMADSITTWQLSAEAIAKDGRLGQATAEVRVFQDFFVDLDLPSVVTQHDELAVPVAVYNYLTTPQRITLTLDDARWFTRSGEAQQTIDLQPSQVGVRYFRIRVCGVGRQKLLVRAHGSAASDAIERSVEISPDGLERAVAFQDRLLPGRVQHRVEIPADAIADASVAGLKIYPAMSSHVIEGLDSMLQMPGGCFEQTSSTTYPNALILDYLGKSGKLTAEIEKKAKGYLASGYQRLLSFEVSGGGFSWFGQAPANKILTAYGLREFFDMARVHPVDARVIERTQAWLVAQQRADGSFAPDTYFINEGATNRFNSDVLRITAYIAAALKATGYRGPALDRASGFVRQKLASARDEDPYTLALATELLAGAEDHAAWSALVNRLWQQRKDQPDGRTSAFSSTEKTPTYGDGKSGTVETTALAAAAMLAAPGTPNDHVDRAIGYLLSAKDSLGNWYSTQATILSLKALLAYGGQQKKGKGRVTVTVDGNSVAELQVDAAVAGLHAIDLPALAQVGKHEVSVRFDGEGQLAYQLVGRYFEPRTAAPVSSADAELEVATHVDHASVAQGGALTEEIAFRSLGKSIDMPIVTAGLPPGFDLDGEQLDALVKSRKVEKIQRTPGGLVFYLTKLDPGTRSSLTLHLRSRFPARVQIPAPTVYEYYRPERKAVGSPVVVEVRG